MSLHAGISKCLSSSGQLVIPSHRFESFVRWRLCVLTNDVVCGENGRLLLVTQFGGSPQTIFIFLTTPNTSSQRLQLRKTIALVGDSTLNACRRLSCQITAKELNIKNRPSNMYQNTSSTNTFNLSWDAKMQINNSAINIFCDHVIVAD